MRKRILRPQITIAQSEHRQLLALAAGGSGAMSPAADSLMAEIERARIVPDAKLPQDIVRMGSRVQYRTDRDDLVSVELVYPVQADISRGRVSVLTPVGAALIGLRTGQSITWETRDGRNNVLTVLSVIHLADVPEDA
ncbi:nucleoside diphosphate kinase regulator [Devosia rhodophyticola]|uniref:Nucleoside diphosphate kinase regulator n=1 Tax=Devosia rhodophyticola TaxID=3026423 RepID=A0ABY7Z157_9HYPH|nr:nucleoside diphosphate kinase regulator [Devosia rhodophyticola]WDR07261.1 nucleoside diphosphate kinase regulator [Devosia rhodophyticola]